MTPEQAIERAIENLIGDYPDPAWSAAWVAIAAELRAQQAGPALSKLLSQARAALPETDPAERLTLHDIEAKVCAPHERIAIRRNNSAAWWMHPDDKTGCPKA